MVVFLALAALVPAPATLSAEEACLLAAQDIIDPTKEYSIRGEYFSDGMHGSLITLPNCKLPLPPTITGKAAAQMSAYHQAYEKKCSAMLFGDAAAGVFTGRFVRQEAQPYGMREPRMLNFFEVTEIKTEWLDIASIRCAN